MPIFSSLLLCATAAVFTTTDPLAFIYDCIVPRASALSFFAVSLLLLRSLAKALQKRACSRKLQDFGRKGLIITGSSCLFAASCVYRAINIADEGAFLCRGPRTVFNVPVAGRAVATIGEVALVFQLRNYVEDTARRLTLNGRCASSFSIRPVIAAEMCSWIGVLSGTSWFFCVEYMLWVIIAAMWVWDTAELFHRSTRRGDALVHALLLAASLGLIAFNIGHELPHFFTAQPLNADADSQAPARPTPFACTQDADSPIWQARLPFFVTYMIGASTLSVALAARYHMRGSIA